MWLRSTAVIHTTVNPAPNLAVFGIRSRTATTVSNTPDPRRKYWLRYQPVDRLRHLREQGHRIWHRCKLEIRWRHTEGSRTRAGELPVVRSFTHRILPP